MKPLVISHAACGGHAPENSLKGVRKAIELGADAIEIDVQCSADGVPMLMHDPTVDRTTNGTGAVASLTMDELRALDTGAEPIATLEEVLGETLGRVLLVMEIKQPGIEEHLAELIAKMDAVGQVMAWSFFPQALEGMRKADPRVPCALLVSQEALPRWPRVREKSITMGLQGVSVYFPGIDERTVRECRLSGLSLYTWTPDKAEDIERMIELGVDGVCSNYPDRVVAALAG